MLQDPHGPQHLQDPVGGELGADAWLNISTPGDAEGGYSWGSSDPGNLDGQPLLGGKRVARFLLLANQGRWSAGMASSGVLEMIRREPHSQSVPGVSSVGHLSDVLPTVCRGGTVDIGPLTTFGEATSRLLRGRGNLVRCRTVRTNGAGRRHAPPRHRPRAGPKGCPEGGHPVGQANNPETVPAAAKPQVHDGARQRVGDLRPMPGTRPWARQCGMARSARRA